MSLGVAFDHLPIELSLVFDPFSLCHGLFAHASAIELGLLTDLGYPLLERGGGTGQPRR
jgi:hypothetical protein